MHHTHITSHHIHTTPTPQLNGRLVRASTSAQTRVPASVAAWGYSDTMAWSVFYPACGGNGQSPIDFVFDAVEASVAVTRDDQQLSPIALTASGGSGGAFVVTNNGHTVVGAVPSGHTAMSGGMLGDGMVYAVDRFEVHVTSEHTVSE